MLRSLPLFPLALASLVYAHAPTHVPGLGTWYHERDHPVHKLFPRAPTDGGQYDEVGSEAWTAAFPTGKPDVDAMPQEWRDALQSAIEAGKIPDIPTSDASTGFPTYDDDVDPASPEVCSATYKCRVDGDIWDAPDNVLGIGFDDGPWLGTQDLTDFLEENNERATHFVIGLNIRSRPQEFLRILDQGGDIAVHTYTHPYMTSLTNLEVVAEFGWTMEIIRRSAGGRIPKYWRPPTGDMDHRVRSIAREIFGLEVIMWNHDTFDWRMSQGGTTPQIINASLTEWITGPKSPGLIILQHELSPQTVKAFVDAYPLMKSSGWETKSQALLFSESAWLNSDGTEDNSTVTATSVLLPFVPPTGTPITSEDEEEDETDTSSTSDGSSGSGTTSASGTGSTSGSGSGGSSSGNGGSSSSTDVDSALTNGMNLALTTSMLLFAFASLH